MRGEHKNESENIIKKYSFSLREEFSFYCNKNIFLHLRVAKLKKVWYTLDVVEREPLIKQLT